MHRKHIFSGRLTKHPFVMPDPVTVKQGAPIGAYDIQIAAVAMAEDMVLLTNNTKEFKRIDGLKLENWVQ